MAKTQARRNYRANDSTLINVRAATKRILKLERMVHQLVREVAFLGFHVERAMGPVAVRKGR